MKHNPLAEPIIAGQMHKNRKGDVVRVVLSTFEGNHICDIRQFFTGKDGLPAPTRKGLAISITRLPEFARLLEAAQRKAEQLGLLKEAADA